MTYEGFIEEVCWRTGLQSEALAGRAAAATLQVIAERLGAVDAGALEQELPSPLAQAVGRARRHGVFDVTELFARVAAEEPVRPGAAVEHAKVVCEVLTEALPEELRERLHARLPPDWADLFQARDRGGEPPITTSKTSPWTPEHHTLADGRPGSSQPLSEATPPAGQSESVVLSENPHGEEKISSAPGPRPGTPIAVGTAGSEVPLVEGGDPVRRTRRGH